jgi:DNA-binding response OmpR family regulator
MLLDLTLPDGDGLQVLGQLAARGATPRVTAALTGSEDSATARRCREAGCHEVLIKPVATRELLKKVKAWLA